MIIKKYTLTGILLILLTVISMTGCHRTPDMRAVAGALLDTVYKNSPSEYSRLTGIATADLSSRQSQWLSAQTDRFLNTFGGLKPSQEVRENIDKFLSMVYASANYTVQSSQESAVVTIRPITLLTEALPEIQTYTENFNKKNADFEYYELTSQEYADAYLDGLLTILTSKLSDLHYGDPEQVELPFEKGEDGLYIFKNAALGEITRAVLPFPSISE